MYETSYRTLGGYILKHTSYHAETKLDYCLFHFSEGDGDIVRILFSRSKES